MEELVKCCNCVKEKFKNYTYLGNSKYCYDANLTYLQGSHQLHSIRHNSFVFLKKMIVCIIGFLPLTKL